jgi:hypothetical protein
MLALIRPGSWNFPLFLHVLGAMTLVGTLALVATALLLAWRAEGDASAALQRLGFRTVLLGVLPSFILMRVGAQWIYSREFDGKDDPGWVTAGFNTSDAGGLLLLVSIVLAVVGLRRAGRVPGRVVGVISLVLLLAYFVTIWAMTAKPGA